MSRQYLRAASFSVEGTGGSIDVSQLRFRFSVEQSTVQRCNLASIRVYNLSDATAQRLTSKGEFTSVTLTAGYEDNSGVIFKGSIKQTRKGRENVTEKYTDFFCSDGDAAYNYSVTNKALAKGSTPLDHLNAFLDAMKPYGITRGYFPTDILTGFKYPRGVSFFGATKEHIRTLALSNNCTWNILNGQLNMVPAKGYIPGAPTVLNSATGLIGIPEQTDTGVRIRCLINPNILVDRLVQVDQKDITAAQLNQNLIGGIDNPQNILIPSIATDGQYRAIYIKTTGDTRGQEWYMDLECLAINTPTTIPTKDILYLGGD